MKSMYGGWIIILLLIFSPVIFAQNKENIVSLRTGVLAFRSNLRQSAIDSFNAQTFRYNNKSIFALQFKSLPSATTRKWLSENGIELLDYIENFTYTASVAGNLKLQALQLAGTNAFLPLSPLYKLDPGLAGGLFPAHAVKVPG